MPKVLEATAVFIADKIDLYPLREMHGKPTMVVEEPGGHLTLRFEEGEPLHTTRGALVSCLMELLERLQNDFSVVLSLMREGVVQGRLKMPSVWIPLLFGAEGAASPETEVLASADGFHLLRPGGRERVVPAQNAKVEPARLFVPLGLQPLGDFVLQVEESPLHIRAINEDGSTLCENLRKQDILHNGVRVDSLKGALGLGSEPYDVLVLKRFNIVLGYRSDTAQLIFRKTEEDIAASSVTPSDLIQEDASAE